jgi:hypothetical protein
MLVGASVEAVIVGAGRGRRAGIRLDRNVKL